MDKQPDGLWRARWLAEAGFVQGRPPRRDADGYSEGGERMAISMGQSVGERKARRRGPKDVPAGEVLGKIYCHEHARKGPRLIAVLTRTELITDEENAPYPHSSHRVRAGCRTCPEQSAPWEIDLSRLREYLGSGARTSFIPAAAVATRRPLRPIRSGLPRIVYDGTVR
jgi:hypothetical protein